jgi:hypothetical protein
MKPPRMKRGHGSNTTFQSPSGASSFPNTDWVRLSVFLRDSRAALMSRVPSFYAPLMCESLRTRAATGEFPAVAGVRRIQKLLALSGLSSSPTSSPRLAS